MSYSNALSVKRGLRPDGILLIMFAIRSAKFGSRMMNEHAHWFYFQTENAQHSTPYCGCETRFPVIGLGRVGKVLSRESKIKSYHPRPISYLGFIGSSHRIKIAAREACY